MSACPVCGHDIERDHPVDENGVHYCSQGINELPSCFVCRAPMEKLAKRKLP